MSLLDRILEYDRTVAHGRPGPVPVTGGRKVVCAVCPESLTKAAGGGVGARLGLDADTVLLLVVPGARIGRPDSETARGAALLAASSGASDVIVLGHAGCAFRAPTFPLPGPVPSGEPAATDADLVAGSVSSLRSSAWMPHGVAVHGLLAGPGGRLEPIGASSGAAGGASAGFGAPVGPVSPASAGALAPAGPVSFFGQGPAPSLAAPPPPIVSSAGAFGVPPPPEMPTIDLSTPAPTYAAHVLEPIAPPTPPSALTRPPELTRPPDLVRPPEPVRPAAISDILERPRYEAPPPPPAPSPREPPPPPRKAGSDDDPFARAEEILERLRRDRSKRR